MEMQNYYFTYGSSGQPFYGGWTKIGAPTRHIACELFRSIHPDKYEGCLNCSSVYDEISFRHTSMWRNGNFGYREHEIICMQHIIVPEVNA